MKRLARISSVLAVFSMFSQNALACGGHGAPVDGAAPFLEGATFSDPTKIEPADRFRIVKSANGWTLQSGESDLYFNKQNQVCVKPSPKDAEVCGDNLDDKLLPIYPISGPAGKYMKPVNAVGFIHIDRKWNKIYIQSSDGNGNVDKNKPVMRIELSRVSDSGSEDYTWKIFGQKRAGDVDSSEARLVRRVSGPIGEFKDVSTGSAPPKTTTVRCPGFFRENITEFKMDGKRWIRGIDGSIRTSPMPGAAPSTALTGQPGAAPPATR